MIGIGDAEEIGDLEPRAVGHDLSAYRLRTAAAPRLRPAPPVLDTTPTPFGVGIWRSPARPSNWSATSAKLAAADTPAMWPQAIRPPDTFTGSLPPRSVTPLRRNAV